MAVTMTSALRVAQARSLLYEVFRRSVWLNVANRNWESDLANAFKVQIGVLDDSGTVQDRTKAQLEVGPTYSTSGVTNVEFSRAFIRAYDQIGMEDISTLGAGGALESFMAERLGRKTATQLDDKLAGVVAGVSYDTVNGAGNDNLIETGSDSDTINAAFPHRGTTQAVEDFVSALKDAHMLLAMDNVIGGEVIGSGLGSPAAAVMPIPLARLVADYLEDKGELLDRSSIAGQAVATRGILSNSAYMGTFAGLDIVSTNSIAVPTAAANARWSSYVLPTNGTLVAALLPDAIDEARFGDGSTGGAYVMRRTVISKWGGAVVRPEHVIRVAPRTNAS